MVSDAVKIQAKAWSEALQTGVEPVISDLAKIFFIYLLTGIGWRIWVMVLM